MSGLDVAGTVVAAGPEVTRFAAGNEVSGIVTARDSQILGPPAAPPILPRGSPVAWGGLFERC